MYHHLRTACAMLFLVFCFSTAFAQDTVTNTPDPNAWDYEIEYRAYCIEAPVTISDGVLSPATPASVSLAPACGAVEFSELRGVFTSPVEAGQVQVGEAELTISGDTIHWDGNETLNDPNATLLTQASTAGLGEEPASLCAAPRKPLQYMEVRPDGTFALRFADPQPGIAFITRRTDSGAIALWVNYVRDYGRAPAPGTVLDVGEPRMKSLWWNVLLPDVPDTWEGIVANLDGEDGAPPATLLLFTRVHLLGPGETPAHLRGLAPPVHVTADAWFMGGDPNVIRDLTADWEKIPDVEGLSGATSVLRVPQEIRFESFSMDSIALLSAPRVTFIPREPLEDTPEAALLADRSFKLVLRTSGGETGSLGGKSVKRVHGCLRDYDYRFNDFWDANWGSGGMAVIADVSTMYLDADMAVSYGILLALCAEPPDADNRIVFSLYANDKYRRETPRGWKFWKEQEPAREFNCPTQFRVRMPLDRRIAFLPECNDPEQQGLVILTVSVVDASVAKSFYEASGAEPAH